MIDTTRSRSGSAARLGSAAFLSSSLPASIFERSSTSLMRLPKWRAIAKGSRRPTSRRRRRSALSPLSAPRLPISSGAVLGRTATSRASTPAFAMSCSTARSSTPSEKLRSSSKAGGAITIRSGRMPRSATSHLHQRCSCPPSPRGRLRYPDRLRRPRWRNGQP
jgi:hypothetical protein